ncbi:MAG: polymer-forming cytoskeletal protein [Sphingomonadales bacterium]|nr:MAG: polymer-forming cytoskeletal protein [Sphingomonadales bacterium]
MFDKSRKDGRRPGGDSAGGFSVIASDVKIAGNISAGNDLQVNGLIEGDVQCGHLSIGEGGKVVGKISAEEVTLAGSVEGPISATKVELLATAQVTGDVSYQELRIELGAKISGKLNWAQEKGLKLVKIEAAAES